MTTTEHAPPAASATSPGVADGPGFAGRRARRARPHRPGRATVGPARGQGSGDRGDPGAVHGRGAVRLSDRQRERRRGGVRPRTHRSARVGGPAGRGTGEDHRPRPSHGAGPPVRAAGPAPARVGQVSLRRLPGARGRRRLRPLQRADGAEAAQAPAAQGHGSRRHQGLRAAPSGRGRGARRRVELPGRLRRRRRIRRGGCGQRAGPSTRHPDCPVRALGALAGGRGRGAGGRVAGAAGPGSDDRHRRSSIGPTRSPSPAPPPAGGRSWPEPALA